MRGKEKGDLLQHRKLDYKPGDVALVRQVAAENGTDEAESEEVEAASPSDGGSDEELAGADGNILIV